MSYTVAQNTSFLTTASIIQKVISFLYFTLVARQLGVGDTGEYFFAIVFTSIFVVIADFGFGAVFIREAAKFPERMNDYLHTVLCTKLIGGLVTYFLAMSTAFLLGYSRSLLLLIALSGVTMVLDNLHGGFYAALRAAKNLRYEAVGIIVSQLITLGIGSVALLLHWPTVWLIAAYTIPSGLNIFYAAWAAQRSLSVTFRFHWQWPIVRAFFLAAIPFALASFIGRLYSYSDSLIMSKMLTAHDLGLWSVPYKISFAFQFIPAALAASVYPAMSRLFIADPKSIDDLFQKSWRYLLTIALPLSAGLGVLAGPILAKFFGAQYVSVENTLRILLVSLVFSFLSAITGATLNALNKQHVQTGIVAGALVVNIFLNILLLPHLGIMGAAVAALVGNIILCSVGYLMISHIRPLRHTQIIQVIFQTLLPALGMGVVVWWFSSRFHLFLVIPVGVLVYGALLFVSGGLSTRLLQSMFLKTKL